MSEQIGSRRSIHHSADGRVAWLKLPFVSDPTPMQAELDSVADDWWISHFVQDNYRGAWTIAPLRGPAGETHPIRLAYSDPSTTDWQDTELLDSCPAMREAIGLLKCPIKSTRLMRLDPGSEILEHTDHDLGFEDGEVRLHIPIETSQDVEFMLDGERIEMMPGELWYLNVNLPHSVANRGSSCRTHLVIDCEVNDWVRELFQNTLEAKK